MATRYVEMREGAYRVAGTRVSLDSVVYGFIGGQSPETIAQSFAVLTLEQVYGSIAFYLGRSLPGSSGPRLRGEASSGTRRGSDVFPEARGREEAGAAHMTDSARAASLLREALSLPESERLDLAATLIQSVDNGSSSQDVGAAWASEARRRLAEVQSGVVKPVPWEDAEKRIFATV